MKNSKQKEVKQKAWETLWELAQNQIIWDEGKIDHDGFISEAQKIFELKIKNTYFEGKTIKWQYFSFVTQMGLY